MEKKRSMIDTNEPPEEHVILQKWKDYWIISQNKPSIEKLIERIKYQFEFDDMMHNYEERKEREDLSKKFIERILNISNFPKAIPSWTEIDGENKEIYHPKQKVNPYSEFKNIMNKSEIEFLFRKYYKNIFKNRIVSLLFLVPIILLLGAFFYSFSFWSFKWSPFANYFESNPWILLYLWFPTIYSYISAFSLSYFLISKVNPSKWHFLDLFIIIIPPLIFYVYELLSDLNLINLFITTTLPIDLHNLIRIYSTLNSFFILLLGIGTISYSIIPCTTRGRLLYSLLKLEFSIKSNLFLNLKNIPKYFHETLISLNDLLMEYFGLTLENLNEVEGAFNSKLLLNDIKNLNQKKYFSENKEIIKYFSRGINVKYNQEVKKKSWFSKNSVSDKEREQNFKSIKIIIAKLNEISKELHFNRTSLKQQLRYKFQKIISITIAVLSFVLSNFLPLFQ